MLNLSFITSFYFVLAIYMIAFLVNRQSSKFLVACIISELAGRLTFFSWALNYEYGVFMHLFWSLIYCYCLMFYWLAIDRIANGVKGMQRFCMIVINISLFLFIAVSFLHLLNGEILSTVWMNLLLIFGASSVLMVISMFIGIMAQTVKTKLAAKNEFRTRNKQ